MTHQIIRTVAELEALDPDTIVLDSNGELFDLDEAWINGHGWGTAYTQGLPFVVIAISDQVRAARKALEEA